LIRVETLAGGAYSSTAGSANMSCTKTRHSFDCERRWPSLSPHLFHMGLSASELWGTLASEGAYQLSERKMMFNDFGKKIVTAVLTTLGMWLAAVGLVTADVWAQVMSPEVITPMAAVVSVMMWKVMDMVSGWFMSIFKSE
jgi:hypothetical protein